MAVQFRDYYEILGVSRTASHDEVRKAFRKKARQYHPDVAKDKSAAEEKFKELNEAYEVLGDPEKRKKYDALGQNWKHGADFGRSGRRPQQGGGFDFGNVYGGETGGGVHFGGTGFSDFFEAVFGGRTTAGFGGFGRYSQGGAGGARRPASHASAKGENIEADLLVTLDEVLHGGKRMITLQEEDGGKKTARVAIPKGVESGQIIRCSGLGQVGAGGAGDLLLKVRLEKHPIYRIEGIRVYHDLEVAPWELVLGQSLPVPTPHGNVKITVPPGIQSGDELRLKGKGLPNTAGDVGDLYVVIAVKVPVEISDEEREVWKTLAKTSSFKPREI